MPRQYSTGKRDANESELLKSVKEIWGKVDILQLREGQGADLIITAWGQTFYVEVKSGPNEKLTAKEESRRTGVEAENGCYWIWRTAEDVQATYDHYLRQP